MKARIVIFLLSIFSFFHLRMEGEEELIRCIHTVKIPEAPGAYNASLIEYEGGYLMAFRYDTYRLPIDKHPKQFYQHLGLVRLDKKFKPMGPPTYCKAFGNRASDPRLFRIGEKIHIVFGAPGPKDEHTFISSHLCSSTISDKGDHFVATTPLYLKVKFQQKFEKNWVPFDYKGRLYLSYSICPHKVVLPGATGQCILVHQTAKGLPWDYGIIRGGTPAVPIEDGYLAFFHSACMDQRTKRYTYYVGAYTFEGKPPFKLMKMSSKPIHHPDFYSTSPVPLTAARVVFPGGLIVKEETIFVCYGENDGAIKVMEIDRKRLLDSLQEVKELIK